MSKKLVTFIDEIPSKPHDSVTEFIENVLKIKDTPSTRHAQPKSDEEVLRARENSVPNSTKNDTKYCLRTWSEWAYNRNKLSCNNDLVAPEDPASVDVHSMAYWLERFILEIRTKHGNEYNPNSLHHFVCGILRHVRNVNPAIDFFKDSQFANFRMTLILYLFLLLIKIN